MDLLAWIADFSKLHERARQKQLSEKEQKSYLSGRDELARALLASQRASLKEGELPRNALRVARALQIELSLPGGKVRALTLDICRGGFSTVLDVPPDPNRSIGFSLKFPSGGPTVTGKCKLIPDPNKRPGRGARASFGFQDLDAQTTELMEMLVFDIVLEQFKKKP